MGAHTPSHIQLEIEDREAELAKLRAELAELAATSPAETDLSEPPLPGSAPQVFISYSRRDIAFVERLAADLERAGLVTWWDVSNLVGGEAWAQTIETALKESNYCAVVLSPDSVKATWVRKEYIYAMRLGLEIIPILYRPCDTPILAVLAFGVWRWLPLRQSDLLGCWVLGFYRNGKLETLV